MIFWRYDFEDAFRNPSSRNGSASTDSAQRNITPVADSDNDRSGQPSGAGIFGQAIISPRPVSLATLRAHADGSPILLPA